MNVNQQDLDAIRAKRIQDEADAQKAINLTDPSFGTGSLLTRPEDTSIQGASEDFMKYLSNPTNDMTPPPQAGNPSAIEDFDAMKEQDAMDKSMKAPVATPPSTKVPNMGSLKENIAPSTQSAPSAVATPQEDILAQLKAARDANVASLAGARQSDKMTELGNLIMKSGAMAGEGIVNQSGNTKIKLDAAQSATDESKFANEGAKSKLEALMQDYGITKGIDDTAYNRKKDDLARKDKLDERADENKYRNRMLDITESKNKTDKKESDGAGQKKLDQEFAKEYQDWSSGGQKIAQSEIGKLKGALNKLETGKVTTGGLTGMFPDQMTSNKVLSARSDIQSSVMGSLRALLGAQFTEKEGERVIKNTWNEADSTENNIARVKRLVGDLENKANDKTQKSKYFENKGSTLKGYDASFSNNNSQQSTSPSVGKIISSGGKRYKVVNDAGDLEEIK